MYHALCFCVVSHSSLLEPSAFIDPDLVEIEIKVMFLVCVIQSVSRVGDGVVSRGDASEFACVEVHLSVSTT